MQNAMNIIKPSPTLQDRAGWAAYRLPIGSDGEAYGLEAAHADEWAQIRFQVLVSFLGCYVASNETVERDLSSMMSPQHMFV